MAGQDRTAAGLARGPELARGPGRELVPVPGQGRELAPGQEPAQEQGQLLETEKMDLAANSQLQESF